MKDREFQNLLLVRLNRSRQTHEIASPTPLASQWAQGEGVGSIRRREASGMPTVESGSQSGNTCQMCT